MAGETVMKQSAEWPLQVRPVAMLQPLEWLRRGWGDLAQHRGASLAYGVLVTALGWVILMFAMTHVYFMAAAISGFMLFGPIMATGLCDLSRRQSRGESVTFDASVDALGSHPVALRHFAFFLFALSLFWFLISGLLLETLLGRASPSMGEFLWGDMLAGVTSPQLVLYLAIGGLLAVIAFVLSVVSVPAILDRGLDAMEAMQLSARVTVANLPAMLVWAALIVLLTMLGFATFLLGLILIYPLLGHATWYAYRDLVR